MRERPLRRLRLPRALTAAALLLLCLALGATFLCGCAASTRATTVWHLGDDERMAANDASPLFKADDEALAWTDANTLALAEPRAVLEALIRDGRDPDYQAELAKALDARRAVDWDWLLECALAYDHRAVGRFAVRGGADPNRLLRVEWHALAEEGQDDLVATLADGIVQAQLPAIKAGATPLFLAGASGNLRAQAFLLDVGADPNRGATPPILAPIRQDDLPLVQRFVACGADIASQPVAGEAVSPAMAEWLVAHGAGLKPNADQFSPLQASVARGDLPIARVFMRHEPLDQPLPLASDHPRVTALFLAATKHPAFVPELLEAGADPFVSNLQAFAVAKALLLADDAARFRALGFSPNLTRPRDPEMFPEGTPPISLLEALLDEACAHYDPERARAAIRAANLLLDLGADATVPAYTLEVNGVAQSAPLRERFAERVRLLPPPEADAPEAAALQRELQALLRRLEAESKPTAAPEGTP